MKKMVLSALVLVMALSMAACASTAGDKKMQVKCPACGYEFLTPIDK